MFLRTVSTFSFKLLPSGPQTALNPYSVSREDYILQWSDYNTHPHQIHKEVQRALATFQQSYLRSLIAPTGQDDNHTPLSQGPHVTVFPMIQAGQFGIREEETVLELLLRNLDGYGNTSARRPLLDLTSGYFGLYRRYRDVILKSSSLDTRIVCSAPKVLPF